MSNLSQESMIKKNEENKLNKQKKEERETKQENDFELNSDKGSIKSLRSSSSLSREDASIILSDMSIESDIKRTEEKQLSEQEKEEKNILKSFITE